MTTATALLDLGLAAGTSALVTTAMFVIPNIERIRARGREQRIRTVLQMRERRALDPQLEL
jgi:hypothetical protein